jgi:hypothetical protein
MINIKDGYELYFEFKGLELKENIGKVVGGYFHGPVISNHVKLLEKDNIILDFSHQHRVISPDKSFYTAKLSWEGTEYVDDLAILLKKSNLEYKKVGLLRSLTAENFFIIDTFNHREEVHAKYPMYKSWILDSDGYPLGID